MLFTFEVYWSKTHYWSKNRSLFNFFLYIDASSLAHCCIYDYLCVHFVQHFDMISIVSLPFLSLPFLLGNLSAIIHQSTFLHQQKIGICFCDLVFFMIAFIITMLSIVDLFFFPVVCILDMFLCTASF